MGSMKDLDRILKEFGNEPLALAQRIQYLEEKGLELERVILELRSKIESLAGSL